MASHKKLLLLALMFLAFFTFEHANAAGDAAQAPLKNKAVPHDPHAGLDRMNGYSIKDVADFTSKWAFVTVRYRKDTGEMRLTYANDSAWKALQEGKTDYPDGAMFAKIGLMTADDPGFVSSLVPSGAKRYQLMVMDRAKNKDTDGWGYAVFDANGKTFGDDPIEKQNACHACHKMVPERGYVFSQPVKLNMGLPMQLKISAKDDADKILSSRLVFETVGLDALPEKLKKELPDGTTKLRQLRGELEKTFFVGTFGEIRPSLAKEALKSDMPAALVSNDGRFFSLAFKEPNKPACDLPNGKKGVMMKVLFVEIQRGDKKDTDIIDRQSYCDGL
ncbi:MAG: cytochrome P460 family protein [Alphaproteobacteria bacterium]|nr:cytochrome P460 family protein [Alphaproteobacteria bacterium]